VLIWLPWQARQMESNDRQEQLIADTLWVEQTLRFELARSEEALAALGADLVVAPLPPAKLTARFRQMFTNGPELVRVVWSDADGVQQAIYGSDLPAAGLPAATVLAGEMARSIRRGRYSVPYGATASTHGVIDYYLPLFRGGQFAGSLVATYSLQVLLDETVPWWFAQDNALTLLDRNELPVAHRAGRAATSTRTSASSTCPARNSCCRPTASSARRNCCPTCWSAR
jgi:two-component system sensor histidine kinase DctS